MFDCNACLDGEFYQLLTGGEQRAGLKELRAAFCKELGRSKTLCSDGNECSSGMEGYSLSTLVSISQS